MADGWVGVRAVDDLCSAQTQSSGFSRVRLLLLLLQIAKLTMDSLLGLLPTPALP